MRMANMNKKRIWSRIFFIILKSYSDEISYLVSWDFFECLLYASFLSVRAVFFDMWRGSTFYLDIKTRFLASAITKSCSSEPAILDSGWLGLTSYILAFVF
jgi:hypothetical protein